MGLRRHIGDRERDNMTRRLLAGSVCAFLAVSPVNAQQLRATSFEPCPDPLAAATKLRDYRVRQVAINTPFDFLRTVRNMLDRLTARLPQQADQPFVDADVSKGAALIQNEFGAGVYGVGAPFKLTGVTAVVDNCRSVGEARELDVVYSVYSTEIPFSSARTFESVEKNRRDPMQGVGVAEGQTPRVRPRLAYDRSTKLRGGADVEVVDVGLLDHLTLGAEGSSESHLVNAATAGGWDVGRSWLQRWDWHTEYRYSDQPTEGGGLTRNRAVGHMSFLLRNVGSGPHLRTGVSVEGGHLESELDAGMVPADNLVNTPYTAIKGYVGATLRRGVVARIVTGPHDANRQDSHLPMRYDTGRPRAIIRLRISQPRTTSLPCPAGLRARRPSPMMDLYRKNTFSTRL